MEAEIHYLKLPPTAKESAIKLLVSLAAEQVVKALIAKYAARKVVLSDRERSSPAFHIATKALTAKWLIDAGKELQETIDPQNELEREIVKGVGL